MASKRVTRSMSGEAAKKARLEASDERPGDPPTLKASESDEGLGDDPLKPVTSDKQSGDPPKLGVSDRNEAPVDPLNLLSFPNELLLKIGEFLQLPDLLNLSYCNKRLYGVFAADNETWKRLFKNSRLTRSSLIEETVASELEKSSSDCSSKVSFKLHRETQIKIATGNGLRLRRFISDSRLNESNFEATIPVMRFSPISREVLVSVWDEATVSTKTFTFYQEDIFKTIVATEMGTDEDAIEWLSNQIILQDSFVVLHWKKAEEFESVAMAVCRIEEDQKLLTNLWHETAIQINGVDVSDPFLWWITVIEDKLYRFGRIDRRAPTRASLEIFDLQSGVSLKKIPLEHQLPRAVFRMEHNKNWIAMECYDAGRLTLIFDIQNTSVKYVEGIPVGIKGDMIYTTGSPYTKTRAPRAIPISKWDAQTGDLIGHISGELDHQEDEVIELARGVKKVDSIFSRDRIFLSKDGPVVFYNDRLVLYKDVEEGGLDKVSEISLHQIQEMALSEFMVPVWHLIQNCAVICFEGQEHNQSNIYLAFVALSGSSVPVIKRIQNLDIEHPVGEHYLVLQSTPTSLVFHSGRSRDLAIFSFFDPHQQNSLETGLENLDDDLFKAENDVSSDEESSD